MDPVLDLPSPSPPPPPSLPQHPPSSLLGFFGDLSNNPVFAGGFGLATLGTFAALGRRAVLTVAAIAKRRMLVTVEIGRQDPSYPWILAWLAEPRPASGVLARGLTRIHELSVATTVTGPGSGYPGIGGTAEGVEGAGGAARPGAGGGSTSFHLQPGYGRHIVRFRGAYLAVRREKGSTANMATGEPHEVVTVTTLWRQREVLEAMFREAHGLASKAREGRTVVYTAGGRAMDWTPLGEPRLKRPLGSVVLDKGVKERIVDDVHEFLARRKWYVDRGIPYRRGYLLHGPPGSGKSSFIQALAGHLDYAIAMVNLAERGMTDDRLVYLLTTRLPRRCLLLLEDADAAFANRRQVDADGYSGSTVTFSGLLNALDGLAAGEDRLAFLTTNHADRLDPALVRPGRVDVTVRLGNVTPWQAARMWERFYGDEDDKLGTGREMFVDKLRKLGLFEGNNDGDQQRSRRRTSAAAIQGLFLLNKNDMEGAIRMADMLVPSTDRKG